MPRLQSRTVAGAKVGVIQEIVDLPDRRAVLMTEAGNGSPQPPALRPGDLLIFGTDDPPAVTSTREDGQFELPRLALGSGHSVRIAIAAKGYAWQEFDVTSSAWLDITLQPEVPAGK